MGSALARFGDIPSMKATQRESLAAFLRGVDGVIDRFVATFDEDVSALPEEERVVSRRISGRATNLKANVADELVRLNDSAQGGPDWWKARLVNGRRIAYLTDELSEDMIGFLQTGSIPSEVRARNEMIAFGVVATIIAGTGYYLWWRNEKAAEAEIQAKLDSGELEDCGCTAPA